MDDLEKKERMKKYNKEYYEKNKKTILIRTWKTNGLIGDYDDIYDRYIASTHCELCNQPYKNSKDKCMDHCHITGEFRNICCHSCNLNLPRQDEEITYDRYISPMRNSWQFRKVFKGKIYQKCRKSRIDLLCYKYIAFLQIRAEWRKLTD